MKTGSENKQKTKRKKKGKTEGKVIIIKGALKIARKN